MHWEQVLTAEGVPTGQHRCTRPGHLGPDGAALVFDIGEVCTFCVADPGSPLEDLDIRPATENRILADAAELRRRAVKLYGKADKLLAPDCTSRDAEAAGKLYAEARKSLVDAAKLEDPVLRRDHTRFLAAERRRMHGRAAN